MEDVWKEIWPSSTVLGDYIYTNKSLFQNKTILELGAGFSAIPSMIAAKCGAKNVIITDKISIDTPQIQKLQQKNLSKNLTKSELKRIQIAALDWNETKITEDFVQTLPALDFILGSDIFYDPSVFHSILQTVNIIFKKFPNVEFIFAYQNRDSRWSIGCELKEFNLKCERLHISIEEEHEISIGKITLTTTAATTTTMASGDSIVGGRKRIYAGVEGGATHFNFIFIDGDGNKLGEGTGLGLNVLLEGIEQASDKIASALRQCAITSSIPLPIDSLGLGLSGAEDEEVNNSMIEYFKTKHSDICSVIHLTTDAVISIAATFSKGGVVIIAGTGSTCRLLKEDGEVYGCGGWGHLITDYGSGFWIAQQAVRMLFDVEDGYTKFENTAVENLKKIILNHFKIEHKSSLLNIFYGPTFNKAKIASLCETLALEASADPIIAGFFHDAGCHLSKMLIAVSKNFDQEMYDIVPVLAIGSVWKSWNLLKPGFLEILNKETIIRRVSIYQLEESPRIGAAVLAAKIKLGENFHSKDFRGKTRLIDEIRNIHQ